MSDLEGFVIEYRKIMQWEWYTDVNTAHLFRHCILRANYTDTQIIPIQHGEVLK